MRQPSRTSYVVIIVLLVLSALFILPDTNIELVNEILIYLPGADKPVHFIEHLGIFLGIYFILSKTPLQTSHGGKIGTALTCSILFSITDEIHQLYSAGRSFEKADLVANTLGAITGVFVVSYAKLNPQVLFSCILALLLSITVVTYDSYSRQKHYFAGMKLERKRLYSQAREQYLLALRTDKTNGEIYNNIAWLDLEFLSADPIAALNFAQKAIDTDASNADYLDTYGWGLLLAGRPSESVSFLQKAYAIKPEIHCIHLHLGSAYLALGEDEKAILHLQKQIQINPNDRFGMKAKAALTKIEETLEHETDR